MARGTARSKLIGHSYRDFCLPWQQGAQIADQVTPRIGVLFGRAVEARLSF
jgi:hypothetical protein